MSSPKIPSKTKAVIITKTLSPASPGQAKTMIREEADQSCRDITLQEIPLPPLGPGMIRIHTKAVALNPTDWKTCDMPFLIDNKTGMISGCDFAGEVVDCGSESGRRFKPGDRVAGIIHGSSVLSPQFGAFVEWSAVDAHAVWKLPEEGTGVEVGYEAAATSGVAISTAGLALFWERALDFEMPAGYGVVEGKKGAWKEEGRKNPKGETLLVYGGSTSVSQVVIRFAKLLGMRVVVVASERNWPLMRTLGADVTVDYKDPEKCVQLVREATEGKLKYAFDGISDPASFPIVHASMSSSSEPKIVHVCAHQAFPKDGDFRQPHIQDLFVLSYFPMGRPVKFFGELTPRDDTLVETLRRAMLMAEKMVAEGKLRLQDYEVMPNGLAGIRDGFERARTVGLTQRKLVWRVEETPA